MTSTDPVAGIGALVDETRRRLYAYVCDQPEPVGREQAANALGIPLHRAGFHLDRLEAEGLLEVEFRRLSGRSGPGAGRPSKLYRRSGSTISVSLPPRRYDLVAEILARAADLARDGEPMDRALQTSAADLGHEAARSAATEDDPTTDATTDQLIDLLNERGYEAQTADPDQEIVLRNCPFHALAENHTALVCGLNRDYVQGMVDGLGLDGVTAVLDPAPDMCCVRARIAGSAGRRVDSALDTA